MKRILTKWRRRGTKTRVPGTENALGQVGQVKKPGCPGDTAGRPAKKSGTEKRERLDAQEPLHVGQERPLHGVIHVRRA